MGEPAVFIRSAEVHDPIFKAKRFSGAQLLSVLKRLVQHLRHAWPETLIVFRGDSHFAYPEVMQWIEAQANLHYVTGLTSNGVLQTLAHEVVEQAKRAYGARNERGCHQRQCSYSACLFS